MVKVALRECNLPSVNHQNGRDYCINILIVTKRFMCDD